MKDFGCDLCGLSSMPSEAVLNAHLAGKKHKKRAAELQQNQQLPKSSKKQTSNNDKKGKKGVVKIDVEDSAADIITFKESVGGKSTLLKGDFDLNTNFEGMIIDETSADEVAQSLFLPKRTLHNIQKHKGVSLFGSSTLDKHPEGALFGHLFPSSPSDKGLFGRKKSPSEKTGGAVYFNTHEPFCFVTVGVQGAGKSHTSTCVLESCLVPFKPGNIVKLNSPMTSMVLHYDQNTSSICEAAGLLSPNPSIKARMNQVGHDVGAVPNDKAVILVSPAFYKQRKKFYGDYCVVKPLLFRWRSLTADHIKRIMRIESGENQLYVASFLNLLRGYQRQAVVPEFSDFMKQVRNVCSAGTQKGPLDQRIALLESVVAESPQNASLVGESLDLMSATKQGIHFIITDLTDPLLSKEEANGLFQVLTEQFRTLPTKGGKVLCLDEAHKYMDGVKADGLSEAIVNAARLMRHDGVRLVVSTQSPKALAPELLELVSIACLHHFHSPDWWSYLQSKLPLNQDAFERILSLNSGEAVVFATSHDLSLSANNIEGSHCLPLRIRPRITEDLGSSRRNS
eukprot:CAMPEP_0113435010 /NCGR_PEP_ID=MMETSP0013_2-20120614/36003_1 /TAXON_ID=2843 ORGANISM="Skeletonema costatum, Strain 1716" /NCGR_SAMPLE_ID=MMETSP0013_2 /ASSEMBLY_ACC=CAM_ASM_000158 /LENGTH=566 /DNA_ID=CAMNT_0000325267 /DNA_START=44 /DNA_END=1744 /DNA_ORIENTATION=- /assembly_acc=CAM_ASM_000158